jgi:hypothetical protein
MRRPSHRYVFLFTVLTSAAACGSSGKEGSGGDGGLPAEAGTTAGKATIANIKPSDGGSGIDLSAYPARATLDPAGGKLIVPGGPTLTAAPSVLGDTVTVGMRAVATPPTPQAPGYTVLSPWVELATSRLETTAASGVISLDIPAAPPTEALAHPGLQMLAVVNGITLPVDGVFDPAIGAFHVELLGLPPSFAFALAFNPGVQKISSDDPSVQNDEPVGPVVPWSTLDFWLIFDGSVVKMDGAKKVLAWARAAATAYSNAGLKEPFLRKESVGGKPRWCIHLTTDGSYFGEGVAADHGLFGRQYMSTKRIASTLADPLGSGQASVAHEMFHAIFRSYNIPNLVFCNDAGDECRRSYAGINEGMATAAGYWIDQGSPAKPRPNQVVRPLWWPFAWFTPNDGDTMYMNQDFFVYLLRVGTLANVRMHLEALVPSALPANGGLLDVLAAYGAALDASATGFGGNFTQTWAWYAADRAYIRSPDGWLWPSEPAGGTPGAGYVLDPGMFAAESNIEITGKDCTADGNALDCEVIIRKRYPLGPVLISAKVDGLPLPAALAGKPVTGRFGAFASGGDVAFTVFGEKNGKGSASAAIRSAEGLDVTLANVGTDYPTVRMIAIPSGAPNPDMMVSMSFAGEVAAKVWILCEGAEGSKETYGCIGWDGDNTFTSAGDECLFADYMTDFGQYKTKAECTSACATTAGQTGWRTCKTPS